MRPWIFVQLNKKDLGKWLIRALNHVWYFGLNAYIIFNKISKIIYDYIKKTADWMYLKGINRNTLPRWIMFWGFWFIFLLRGIDNSSYKVPNRSFCAFGRLQEECMSVIKNNPGKLAKRSYWVRQVATSQEEAEQKSEQQEVINYWDIAEFKTSTGYLSDEDALHNACIIARMMEVRGWSKNAICGILGNMYRESTMNPALHEVGGTGFGLVQWTPYTKYTVWCQADGVDINDGRHQVWRLICEMEQGYAGQWINKVYGMSSQEFIYRTDIDERTMAYIFCKNYERPGVPAMSQRQDMAEYYKYVFGWN